MEINGLFKCYNYKETDMLLTQKIAIISAHTIAGPYILPFTLYNNLWLIKHNAKNINNYYPENNKKKQYNL